MKTFEKIYSLVSRIPKGKVTTYGAISKAIGIDPRVVGYALHANKSSTFFPKIIKLNNKNEKQNSLNKLQNFKKVLDKDSENIPCHRVINSKGKISSGYAFGGPGIQRKMLEKEGVKFNKDETVNLEKFGLFIS
nr:MGMT family protein [Candidatus Levybacteria bacterium]